MRIYSSLRAYQNTAKQKHYFQCFFFLQIKNGTESTPSVMTGTLEKCLKANIETEKALRDIEELRDQFEGTVYHVF